MMQRSRFNRGKIYTCNPQSIVWPFLPHLLLQMRGLLKSTTLFNLNYITMFGTGLRKMNVHLGEFRHLREVIEK